jgi:hypothetical protein
MDVVINDDSISQGLPYDRARSLYLAEGVAAVIQVKTNIDSRALKSALTNLATATALRKQDVEKAFRTWTEAEIKRGQLIRGHVVAFETPTKLKTLLVSFIDHYVKAATPPDEQVSTVAIIGTGLISNFTLGDRGGVRLGEVEKRSGTAAVHAGADTLLKFLAVLMDELPTIVMPSSPLTNYLTSAEYDVNYSELLAQGC